MAISEKEEKLVKKLKALNQDELKAYRYAIEQDVIQISDMAADKMFDLFCNGSTCDDIRKLVKGYSLGQIVVARVTQDWDDRKEEKIKKIIENVPSQMPIALLESQEFLADMIRATQRKFHYQFKKYIATGDEETLEGFKLPNNIKEYGALIDTFMKASGFDSEKNVKHTHTIEPPKEPERIDIHPNDPEADLDELLNLKSKNTKDVQFEPVPPKQITDGK